MLIPTLKCVLKNRRRTPIKMFKEIKVLLLFAKLSIFWQKLICFWFYCIIIAYFR